MRSTHRERGHDWEAGMSLLELIISCCILTILATAALPVARYTVLREREGELKHDLREMRDAIDRYKEYSDRGLIRVKMGTQGYPPDLETLAKEVPISGTGSSSKMLRLLRRIPVDPMTKQADWGLRSVGDDPDSTTWSGDNVYDVYSRSTGTALDGTKYSDW